MNRPEQALHQTAIRFLRVTCPEVISFHAANGGYRNKVEAGILKSMGVLAGVSDICLLWYPGKCGFIELKVQTSAQAAKSALTLSQIEFMIRCETIGIPWALATNLDEIRAILKDWRVPCREH